MDCLDIQDALFGGFLARAHNETHCFTTCTAGKASQPGPSVLHPKVAALRVC